MSGVSFVEHLFYYYIGLLSLLQLCACCTYQYANVDLCNPRYPERIPPPALLLCSGSQHNG